MFLVSNLLCQRTIESKGDLDVRNVEIFTHYRKWKYCFVSLNKILVYKLSIKFIKWLNATFLHLHKCDMTSFYKLHSVVKTCLQTQGTQLPWFTYPYCSQNQTFGPVSALVYEETCEIHTSDLFISLSFSQLWIETNLQFWYTFCHDKFITTWKYHLIRN